MFIKTMPLALCLSIAGACAVNASNSLEETNKELQQRVKFQEDNANRAQAELDAIKKHPLYQEILKSTIASQVSEDYQDSQSTKVQNLTSMPRDVLYMILARSGNLHSVRETSSFLRERVDTIKSMYGLPCFHEHKDDGSVGGSASPSPAYVFAKGALAGIYLNEIRVAQEEMMRQAHELKVRIAQQEKLEAAHKARIQKEAEENVFRARKEAEEKATNERIAARKAKEAELKRMATEEKKRQEEDRQIRAERAEQARRAQAEQERLVRQAQEQAEREQAELLQRQRMAWQEQERINREAESARQEQEEIKAPKRNYARATR